MAVKRHIQHIRSKIVENGKAKLPLPSTLYEGEIAVNYADGQETLSIKTSSGNIATFSSDTVREREMLVISSALNDLNTRKVSKDELAQESGSCSDCAISQQAVTNIVQNLKNEIKVNVVQTSGTSTADVMSQDAVTQYLGELKVDVVQQSGNSTTAVMSQSAVTNGFENLKNEIQQNHIDVVQTSGTSSADVMSQSAVSNYIVALSGAIDSVDIDVVQVSGTSTVDVMSQDAVTQCLSDLNTKIDNLPSSCLYNYSGYSSDCAISQSAATTYIVALSGAIDDMNINVVQESGTSSADVMSQQAVTNVVQNLKNELKVNIVQNSGTSTSNVMSQSGVTKYLVDLDSKKLNKNEFNTYAASAITGNNSVSSSVVTVINSVTNGKFDGKVGFIEFDDSNKKINYWSDSEKTKSISGSTDLSGLFSDVETKINTISGMAESASSSATSALTIATFYSGHNSATTLSNIPNDKRLVIATISGDVSANDFSISGNSLNDGYEIHIIVNNSGDGQIIVTFPNSNSYVAITQSITINPEKYGEINVISDGTKLYIRGASSE